MPPRRNPRTPSYRFDKPSGQAVVTLSGRDYYLGPHGTEVSKAEYDRLVAMWLAGNRRPLPVTEGEHPAELTVTELVVRYWTHVERYHRGDQMVPGRRSE